MIVMITKQHKKLSCRWQTAQSCTHACVLKIASIS